MIKVFTIGFTQKSAEQFFTQLRQPELVRLLDIRLNNVSQLAGFTKKNDLKFFLRNIVDIDYQHLPDLAPTKVILEEYKRSKNWQLYEQQFWALMAQRQIETLDKKNLIHGGCLLCSEATPQYCHRRLVAEYFQEQWEGVEIQHL